MKKPLQNLCVLQRKKQLINSECFLISTSLHHVTYFCNLSRSVFHLINLDFKAADRKVHVKLMSVLATSRGNSIIIWIDDNKKLIRHPFHLFSSFIHYLFSTQYLPVFCLFFANILVDIPYMLNFVYDKCKKKSLDITNCYHNIWWCNCRF